MCCFFLLSYLFFKPLGGATEISFLVYVTCVLRREGYFLATNHFGSKPMCIDCFKFPLGFFVTLKGRTTKQCSKQIQPVKDKTFIFGTHR